MSAPRLGIVMSGIGQHLFELGDDGVLKNLLFTVRHIVVLPTKDLDRSNSRLIPEEHRCYAPVRPVLTEC